MPDGGAAAPPSLPVLLVVTVRLLLLLLLLAPAPALPLAARLLCQQRRPPAPPVTVPACLPMPACVAAARIAVAGWQAAWPAPVAAARRLLLLLAHPGLWGRWGPGPLLAWWPCLSAPALPPPSGRLPPSAD
jgi:hypothetical protein